MKRKELESAAANYHYLRGLLSVPAGIVIIASGLGNLAWGPFKEPWVFVAVVIAAGAVCLLITRYYTARYGRVTLTTKAWVKAAAIAAGAAVVVGGVQADWNADVPISATACTLALVMVASYGVTVGVRVHHAIIWGGVVVAALLPVWSSAGPEVKINIGLVIVGGATILTGVFDHVALKRGFEVGGGDAGA